MTNLDAEPRSAYIHVPFCAHRCGYCDFTLVARRDDLIEAYLEALTLELDKLERPRDVDTLFFGGGTPTHLPAKQFERLLELALRWFPPRQTGPTPAEICVEANPAGLDDAKIGRWPVTASIASVSVCSRSSRRFSSCSNGITGADIRSAVERLRPAVPNLGFDLIFGIPGQSLSLWQETLDEALELAPTHISTYGLTFEKGTTFYSRLKKGTLQRCDEEGERAMYAAAMDRLAAAGFEQYELSNFARPGFRSRHNEVYWQGLPFFGFGPGAARYIGGRRDLNHRSVTTWINRVLSGASPIAESEQLPPEEQARELVMLGLRRSVGIDLTLFHQQTGFELRQLAPEALSNHLRHGLLEEVDGHVRLTREGRFLADTVAADFL